MEHTHPIKHLPRLDKVLVKAIQARGEVCDAAWDYIFHHWVDYFTGTIRRNGGTEEDAREMLGEVYEPVERALRKNLFQYKAPLQTYINRAVLYQWYALLKKQNRLAAAKQKEADLLQSEFEEVFADIYVPGNFQTLTTAHNPFDDECYQLALEALKQKLPKKYEILIASKIDGKRQGQIAKQEDMALQTVKNYVRDAKIFIRDWFGEHPDCMD